MNRFTTHESQNQVSTSDEWNSSAAAIEKFSKKFTDFAATTCARKEVKFSAGFDDGLTLEERAIKSLLLYSVLVKQYLTGLEPMVAFWDRSGNCNRAGIASGCLL